MLSWYRVEIWFSFVLLPLMVLIIPGVLPTAEFNGSVIGGGPVREWLLNSVLMPVLSEGYQTQLVSTWAQAGLVKEILIYLLVVLHVFILLLPLLYGLGNFNIQFINSFKTQTYRRERQSLKRH